MSMSFELKETEENKNYLIAKLEKDNEEYYFIHDKETGENYFNQSVLKELFGVTQQKMSRHLNKYLEQKERINTNTQKVSITLKMTHSDKPVHFYSFDAVTYLAYKLKTEEALSIRDWISQALNEKYNHERGFTKEIQANTINKEQLKNGIRHKNRAIQKLYTCYDILKEIEHDKTANMVYHDIKQESSEVETLKDTFILLEKSEQILKSKQPTTQTKLIRQGGV